MAEGKPCFKVNEDISDTREEGHILRTGAADIEKFRQRDGILTGGETFH